VSDEQYRAWSQPLWVESGHRYLTRPLRHAVEAAKDTSRPSVFAVLKLMTNSYLVDSHLSYQ
jgi:hypothetical protein